MIWSNLLPRVRTTAGFIKDAVYVMGTISIMGGALLYGVYSLNKGWIVSFIQEELQLDALATADSVAELADSVAELAVEVRKSTGADRIIRQPPGLSYVTEPVKRGEPIDINLVFQRTKRGDDCQFVSGQSLFRDRRNILLAGSSLKFQRNIGTDETRMRVTVMPPVGLEAGRIETFMSLEYNCEGTTVFDRTQTLTYQLKG